MIPLSNRIVELETILQKMSRSFSSFNDDIEKLGLLSTQPGLLHNLKVIAGRFRSIRKDCDQKVDDPSTVQQDPRGSNSLELEDGIVQQPINTGHVTNRGSHGHSNFELKSEPSSIQNRPLSSSTPNISTAEVSYSSPLLQQLLYPKGTFTYSFQESSFARRLHRRCLENAYILLLDPSINTYELENLQAFIQGL